MPFALLIVGASLVISGLRGTSSQLISLVKADFQGSDNFIYWIAAFLAIGALGYINALKPISRALLALIIVVIFLTDGSGFFSQFTSALNSSSSSVPATASVSVPSVTAPSTTVPSTTTPSTSASLFSSDPILGELA